MKYIDRTGGIKMKRPSIKCIHCGGNDFEVTVNTFIPRAITLECKCGYITPIAFLDKNNNAYGINDEAATELYNRTFYEDIEPKEAAEAVVNYYKNKEEQKEEVR